MDSLAVVGLAFSLVALVWVLLAYRKIEPPPILPPPPADKIELEALRKRLSTLEAAFGMKQLGR